MNMDFEKIKYDLSRLGVCAGDKIMVHSSFKSLGKVDGGVMTFIDALKDTVTTEGTLFFPTFTYDCVNRSNPVFDVESTVSHVGIIPEIFRKTDGVKRSVHPTHSLAVWGKGRDEFIKDHCKDNVCVGENSPLFKLKNADGKILMVGCGITHNTLIHGVECFYKPPYAFKVDYSNPKYYRKYVCIDENDNVTRREFFHEFMEESGWYQDYNKLKNLIDIKEGKILDATCYLMDAKSVWDAVLKKMQEDPYYFVSRTTE